MTRVTKQFAYGIFYALLFGCMAAVFYFSFLRSSPGCFNARQDSGEEGVDCGGICAAVCIPEDFRPLTTSGPVALFRPTPRSIAVLARVENPNFGLAAGGFSYAFTLKGVDDSVIDTVRGTSFAHAGEVKYLVGVASIADAAAVRSVSLSLGEPTWVSRSAMPKPESLSVQNLVTERDDVLLRIRIAGRVMNRGTGDVEDTEVIAILKNEAGESIGTVRSVIGRISAGATREFALFYPLVAAAVPGRTEIIVSARQ